MKRYLVRNALIGACAIGTTMFGVGFASAMSPLDLSTQTVQSVTSGQTNPNLIMVRDHGGGDHDRGGDRDHGGHHGDHRGDHRGHRDFGNQPTVFGGDTDHDCANHYRFYRAQDDTYLSYGGVRAYCH